MDRVLSGVRVVEIAGLGPAPFAAMMLADAGADVVRVARTGDPGNSGGILERGRPTVEVDLKDPTRRDEVAALIGAADVLVEGFRPGVMERLGLGPERLLTVNPGLVYARMTGWGQNGHLAARAGHDINYLAQTGTLHSIARRGEAPMPPLNLVADFGGGGMLLAYGIVAALMGRVSTGRGRVVDASMADGTSLLMVGVWSRLARGTWNNEPGTNDLDTGAPFYNVYETADRRYLAVGAVEPVFYRRAIDALGLDPEPFLALQHDRTDWPRARARIAQAVAERDLGYWENVFVDLDACVTPVLDLEEARTARFARDRGLFLEVDGVVQPAPAPRFGQASSVWPAGRTTLDETRRRWADERGRP